MVGSATSFSRSGLSDWLVQRFSAVILGAYTLCIMGTFVVHQGMDYQTWRGLFANDAMRIFSLIALLALCAHGWIGMWTVATDYMNDRQLGRAATGARLLFQAACALLLVVCLLWGVRILWSTG